MENSQPKSEAPTKLSGLQSRLSENVAKTHELISLISERLTNIYRYNPPEKPQDKGNVPTPQDLIEKILSDVSLLESANDKLNKILEHCRQIG